ncbi:hypothetical protein VTL71DRAFT_12019 [Oculimacula yallundae]|uniref:Uncharacterized protein n=1 Tax=Oculimacula yallundae TaxID=86028 RepID=A0ABR4CU47_9HELO
MPKVKNDSDIELQCILCPKDPRFSDISHLLTHISSKSHLAHRFKLEIRAQSEIECKEKLDEFAFWYNQNGLDVLLSERMAAKNNKKAKKTKASDASTVSKTSTAAAITIPSLELKPFNLYPIMSVLTLLILQQLKKEKKAKPATAKEVLARTPVYRAPVPRMSDWQTHGDQDASMVDWEPSTMYTTPTARRRVPNFTHPETPASDKVDPKYVGLHLQLLGHSTYGPSSLTTPLKTGLEDSDYTEDKKAGETLTDSAKLKGIKWPGMDVFDAATPEGKRMRNQRKDHTVLEDMIATSLASEPAEVSFHANWDPRTSRDIFGPLSAESSPTRSIPSQKKKKPRQAAKALSNLSTNGPRRAPRGKKAIPSITAPASPEKRQMRSMQATTSHYIGNAPVLNPLANFDRRYTPTPEEDEEFQLTVGNMTKKRGFTIFQDIPEVSPGRTETPLEDHRFEFFSSHGLPSYPSNSMNTTLTLASPTPVPRPTTYRTSGKENGQPEMQTYHPNRRALSDPQVYPPHAYHEGASNPLFNHVYARSHGYGLGTYSYTGYGDIRSPNSFNPSFLNDYNKQPNPIANMGQLQGHGTGQPSGNSTNMNDFGI